MNDKTIARTNLIMAEADGSGLLHDAVTGERFDGGGIYSADRPLLNDANSPSAAMPPFAGGMPEILADFERRDVALHPLFVSLAERSPSLTPMWTIVHNFREGISQHLVRWLTHALQSSSTSIQCILIGMLHDELGAGVQENVHSTLLDRWYEALAPWKPAGISEDDLIKPGRELGLRLEGYFANNDINIALASVMVAEVFAEKFDKCLLREVERTSGLTAHELKWLTMHCQVEEEHAEAAARLAILVGESVTSTQMLRLAAEGTWNAFYQYLTEVMELLSVKADVHEAS